MSNNMVCGICGGTVLPWHKDDEKLFALICVSCGTYKPVSPLRIFEKKNGNDPSGG